MRPRGDTTLVAQERGREREGGGALSHPGRPVQEERVRAPSARAADRSRFASGCSGTDAKGSIHLLGELLRGSGRVEDDDPLGEALRELAVPGGRTRVERVGLALEAVVLSPQPTADLRDVQREQEGPIGEQAADRCEVEVEDALEPEVATDALVGDRRVEVAVADDRLRRGRARAGSPPRRAGRARPRTGALPPTGRRARRAGRDRAPARRAPSRPARAWTRRRARRPRAACRGAPPASTSPSRRGPRR